MQEPLSRITVGTDFSQAAEHALRRALLLPLTPHAVVHLVHVAPDVSARGEASSMITRLAAKLRPAGDPATRPVICEEVLVGDPYVELIRAARRLDAELVVLGRSAGRKPRPTTAANLVCKGDIPLLEVARDPEGPYRRPLVATELDDASRRVLDLALRVVDSSSVAIDVVHAFHIPFEGFVTPLGAGRDHGAYQRSLHAAAAGAMSELLGLYAGRPITWNPILVPGETRAALVDQLVARRSDLLVLGTHGRTGVAHALVGSVAREFLVVAPCDVLVARPVRHSFPRR